MKATISIGKTRGFLHWLNRLLGDILTAAIKEAQVSPAEIDSQVPRIYNWGKAIMKLSNDAVFMEGDIWLNYRTLNSVN